MPTRLLAALAVLGAALLAPSAALAAPTLASPGPSPVVTNSAPIEFAWSGPPENLSRIVSGDLVSGSCPPIPLNSVNVSGDLPFSTFAYSYTPGADSTACYYAEADEGLGLTDSDPVLIVYDTTAPSAVITSPVLAHTTANALTATATDAGSGVASVTFERSTNGIVWTPISTDTSTPYTADWDTTDGLYLVHAVATDVLGNPSSTSPTAPLRVDTTPPLVSLTAPAGSSTVHGSTVTVSATASDPGGAGVTSVAFHAQGAGAPIPIDSDSTGSPYSVIWDTTGVPDGLYTVWAVATDAATLQTTSTTVTNVRVDNTAPTGSVTAPTGGALLHGTTNGLVTSASDVGGVASVAFEQSSDGGAHWTPISTDSTGPTYTANWDTSGLDGAFLIHSVITDAVGNTPFTTPSVAVTIDNTPPTVTLGGLSANQTVSGSVLLSATAADTGGSGVASVQFGRRLYLAGGAYANIGSAVTTEPYDTTFVTTGVADGRYEIQALATDVAGNTTQSASVTNVLIDNHAPLAPAAPTGLSPVAAAPTITFNGSTDPPSSGVQSGVDHYDIYRGGVKVNVAAIPHTGVGPYSWSDVAGQSSAPASGTQPFSYTVKAVDAAGNVSAASGAHLILLDPTAVSAPTAVAALATPTSQRPQVSWVAPVAPPPFAVDHYDIYRDAVLVFHTNGPVTTFTEGAPSLPDGSYTYQVVAAAADGTNGVASGAVTIIYDTMAPAAPGAVAASAALDGSVGIGWAVASDGAGSGVARYVVRRSLSPAPPLTVTDGDAICQGVTTSCTDAAALNGKLYSYAVFAVDRAGNTSAAGNSLAVTARDQLPPAAPQGLTAIPGDGNVGLHWTAAGADDDVAGYVLVAKQGGQAPTSDTDGTRVCTAILSASTSCIADALTNGATYTFGLFALDEALNRSQPAVVSAAPNGKVGDAKAPAAVSKLKATVSGHKVTLTWKNPADRDFDHVEIMAGARKPAAIKASRRVYSGNGTKATTTLSAGQSRWFVVVAYDLAGNSSAAASVHVTIAAASKFGPAPRARVHGRVRLSWPLAKGARYYNVQVYAGRKRILVSWPNGRTLRLPRTKLKRGTTYTWYVWPGLGAKAKAHYGKLIGKNAFTFTG